jgi:hypothetical protein
MTCRRQNGVNMTKVSEPSMAAADGALRFRTRNYKHEIRIEPGHPRSVLKYTDELWEALCERLVAGGFTGLVFYGGKHPFEFILDYRGFATAATRDPAHCRAVRDVLKRGMAIAHRHGLRTFLHHYINHFTQSLADAHDIRTSGRLSAIDHPQVDRYCRWVYRETFRQLPDLDGLYFNFESTPNGSDHVIRTALREFAKMKRKPHVVYRLWGFSTLGGLRQLLDAYDGPTIVSHKISDTNDTYYLPVADSRASEWKARLGRPIEWMFEVGPCHNCGTNLCDQLWSDYDFVQALLADAEAKGADSISFHTLNELFADELPDPNGAFDEREKSLSRLNRLHVQAAIDYVHGRRMNWRQRARFLARSARVPDEAAAPLLKAIEHTSQLVLLTYRQFCYGSAFAGYINRGRFSHIQEPYFYSPATALNDQASSLAWSAPLIGSAWLPKSVDTKVAPENEFQRVIEYVDPAMPQARMNPARIAKALERHMQQADEALRDYRRLAGADKATELATLLHQNAMLGEFVRLELLAAIELCGLYFVRSKVRFVSAANRALALLRKAQRVVADTGSSDYKKLNRVVMFDGISVAPHIESLRRLIASAGRTEFPVGALQHYLASRVAYNRIRSFIQPGRWNDERIVAMAAVHLREAIAAAEQSVEALEPAHHRLARNVGLWLDYLQWELRRLEPPRVECSRSRSEPQVLGIDTCFRSGEDFVEDFLGFFRPMDYRRAGGLSFRVWRTGRELAVELREEGVDVPQRLEQWERFRGQGSDAYVFQVMLQPEVAGGPGQLMPPQRVTVWPKGSAVSLGKEPNVRARADFTCDESSWQTTVYLPFKLLGRTPQPGETWRLNVASNPSIRRNWSYAWSAQYDAGANWLRFGRLHFV